MFTDGHHISMKIYKYKGAAVSDLIKQGSQLAKPP